MRSKSAFVLLLISSGVLLSSCTVLEIQQMGNSIANTMGFGSSQTFGPIEKIPESVDFITPEQEYYIGRAVSAKILELYKPSPDQSLQNYVREMGAAISKYSPRTDTFGGYHFMVLDSDELNAMAAPGGFIFVSRGLIELMKDEDSLASIIAHEVSHVARKHSLHSIPKEDLSGALTDLGMIAGSLSCAEVMIQATALFGEVVDDVVDNLVRKGYSREQEFEADADAVVLMNLMGYDPHGLAEALKHLEAKSSHSSGGWFDTHPAPEDRSAQVQSALDATPSGADNAGRIKRQLRFKRFIKSAA